MIKNPLESTWQSDLTPEQVNALPKKVKLTIERLRRNFQAWTACQNFTVRLSPYVGRREIWVGMFARPRGSNHAYTFRAAIGPQGGVYFIGASKIRPSGCHDELSIPEAARLLINKGKL